MAPSNATEKNRNIGAQLQSILYTTAQKKDFRKFTSCMTGKPRSGTVNSNRVRIKLTYKNAIKEAASNADINFNDGLYNRLCQKDNIMFWKAWRKRFCMQNAKPTGILNGKTGDENVRQS